MHGTGSADHLYNTRPPTREEAHLVIGNGEMMAVKCMGHLDFVLHCDTDVVVTLRDAAFAPGLWYDLMSLNIIQKTHEIVLKF